MIGMMLIDKIASHKVLEQAYAWMCQRRKDHSANSNESDLRRRWNNIKPRLRQQLLKGGYRFDALRHIHRSNDTIELWSALDAMVLKAIAVVLSERLSISKCCLPS